jgi:hypothetical protein
MNLPSIKTLERAFPGKGRELRRLLESPAAVRAHPAAIARDRECYNSPALHDLRLHALDAVAETCGVEYVAPGHNARSPGFEYLNTGDTYCPTIIRLNSGRYIVSSWGDIVERGNYP